MQILDRLVLPVTKKLYLAKLRRIEQRLELLSRRMGLLQLGASAHLFDSVPGLADAATGGLRAKQALAAIRPALEGPSFVHWENVERTLAEIETFLADANLVLDEHDKGRPRGERMFVVRDNVKGLF
jgi:hypothetical protein